MCLGIPGKVLEIVEAASPWERKARVGFGAISQEVSLALVPELNVGDFVVVHVGFVLTKLDAEAARQTLHDLEVPEWNS